MTMHPHPLQAAAPSESPVEPPGATGDRVLGIYADEETANRGVQALLDASFAPERIEVIEVSRGEAAPVPLTYHTRAPRAALAGAVVGGLGGVVAALLLAAGTLAIPGLDLTGAHPWALALQAAFGGVLLGGVAGALVGLYLWRREPAFEEAALQNGAVLVGVPAHDGARREEARRALQRTGALNVRV